MHRLVHHAGGAVRLCALGGLAVAGCGAGGIDVPAVERAANAVRTQCSSASPADDGRVLRADVGIVLAQLTAHPDRGFRYAGGQADLTMREVATEARTILWACAPGQAARLDRALRAAPGHGASSGGASPPR